MMSSTMRHARSPVSSISPLRLECAIEDFRSHWSNFISSKSPGNKIASVYDHDRKQIGFATVSPCSLRP